eukprot:CAMPEP_0202733508 /NCGR_PEP_ID=MMETSP1385-20130828/188206_1 /ASSEMBLY_ACC=CAM_ASM_000861 /TAXON_ID=933848 /ORGANISM="Elphidium margaritaceum" /LENGTH=302 /DNA_ID=CAMNT_0049399843 /DNA_START=519 /DNA_END=1423 /DNA_ORIENTATION=-
MAVYCIRCLEYFVDDEDEYQHKPYHDVMEFVWRKILAQTDDETDHLNVFWMQILMRIQCARSQQFIQHNIDYIVKNLCLLIKNHQAQKVQKCKILIMLLIRIFLRYGNTIDVWTKINIMFSNDIDAEHCLLWLWCTRYPWHETKAQETDQAMVKHILVLCGKSLSSGVETMSHLKLQNGLNTIATVFRMRSRISLDSMQIFGKLWTLIVEKKLRLSSSALQHCSSANGAVQCIDLNVFLALLRVYAVVMPVLEQRTSTVFLMEIVKFLWLFPCQLEMDVCRYLLPNLRWKQSQVKNHQDDER